MKRFLEPSLLVSTVPSGGKIPDINWPTATLWYQLNRALNIAFCDPFIATVHSHFDRLLNQDNAS